MERKNMELNLLVLLERKNRFLARQISARQRGHGFHTRPSISKENTNGNVTREPFV